MTKLKNTTETPMTADPLLGNVDEYGNTSDDLELDMIICSLMLENPNKSFDEIEIMAIEELKEIHND